MKSQKRFCLPGHLFALFLFYNLAVNLNFIIYATSFGDNFGLIFALLILNVAAAESAIGLAILVVYYRLRGSIQIGQFNLLRG